MNPLQQISMNSSWQFTHFHSRRCIWTCRLENGGHFVSASMCKNVNTNNNYSLTMFTSDILSKLANDNSISIYSGFPEMKHRETIKPWLIVWVTGMAVLITQDMGGAQPIRLEIHKEKMHCETFYKPLQYIIWWSWRPKSPANPQFIQQIDRVINR